MMRIETKILWITVSVAVCGWMMPGVGHAQSDTLDGQRWFYAGFGAGTSLVEIDNSSMRLEGVDFSNINADDDDMGTRFQLGYWITQHLALEAGFADRGQVTATFDFSDPRNGRVGTGETDVSVSTFDLSLLAATDIRDVRLFALVGFLSWSTDYETRFDVVNEESVYRDLDESGNDLVFGGGASWNFYSGWSLRAQAEFMEIDISDVQMYTVGLEYDLSPLVLQ